MKKKLLLSALSFLSLAATSISLVSASFVVYSNSKVANGSVTNSNNKEKVKVNFKSSDGKINSSSYFPKTDKVSLAAAPSFSVKGTVVNEDTLEETEMTVSYYDWTLEDGTSLANSDKTYGDLINSNNEVVITGTLKDFSNVPADQLNAQYSENLQVGDDIVVAKDASDTSNIVSLDKAVYNQDVTSTVSLASSASKYTEMVNFNNNSKYKNSQVGYKLNTTNSAHFNKTYESSTNGDTTVGLNNAEANATSSDYKPYLTPNLNTTNNCQNYVVHEFKLENDVLFNGNFTVGGHQAFYGSNNGWSQHDANGFIVGAYNEIDLNGHDLVLTKGSTLTSYGSITDSVGGGKIIIEEGATLTTPLVIEDTTHETDIGAYFNGVLSFNLYRSPYLNATTVVKHGGKLIGNMMKDTGGASAYGVSVPLYLISSDSADKPMFYLSEGEVTREVYYDLNLRYSDIENKTERSSSITNNIRYQRIRYDFYNADVTYNGFNASFKISTTIKINENRVNTPISPYYDWYFHSSKLNLHSQISLMPGAYVNFDETSELNLSYNKFVAETQSQYSSSYQGVGGITAYPSYGTPSLLSTLKNKEGWDYGMDVDSFNDFWAYMNEKEAKVDLNGKVTFSTNEENATQYHPYVLAGNININNQGQFEESYNEALNNDLKIDLHANSVRCFQGYFGLLDFIFGKKIGTLYSYYATMPLISNGKVVFDPTNENNQLNFDLGGTYNNGIITIGDKNYAFIYNEYEKAMDNPYNAEVASEEDFATSVDSLAGKFEEVSVNSNYISFNGENYIFFQGAYIHIKLNSGSTTDGTVNGSFFVTSKSTKLNGSSVNFSYTNNQWKAN